MNASQVWDVWVYLDAVISSAHMVWLPQMQLEAVAIMA
jgi:hypothetical protein